MSTPWRRRARRARRLAAYGAAGVVILAGVLVAAASRLLPLVQSHPEQVAAWLSERSGQPVTFAFGAAEWTRRGPLFALDGLRVGAGEDALDIGRAELLVDVYAGLLPRRPLTELRLRGVDVLLQRGADGRWQLGGMGAGGGGLARLRQLEGLGELQLDAARLRIEDALTGRSLVFDRVDARVDASGPLLRVGARAQRGEGAPLTLAAEFDPVRGDGRAYAGGRDLALADWFEGLDWAGVALHAGGGDADVWAELRDHRIVAVQLEAELESIALRALAPIIDGELQVEPRVGLDALAFSARWREAGAGWQVAVPRLRVDDGGERGEVEALVLARDGGGADDDWRIQAQRLELGVPLSLAMLSERVPPALRQWLYLALPEATVTDLRLRCSGEGCDGHGDIEGLRFRPAGARPGASGIGGRLDLGSDAALLQLRDSDIVLDAPRTFRAPITARLDGTLYARREDGRLVVGSDALSVRGEDFGATAQGSLAFDGDGRPRLDLHAEVGEAPLSAAGQFLVPARMRPRLIDWLDRALIEGRVTGGSLVLQGDLDHWPFRAQEGVLDAEVTVEDVVLDYRPGEWPRGEQLAGRVRFLNTGMQALAEGVVAGIAVDEVEAHIPDFKAPVLSLDMSGGGSGEALLGLLRASPLERRYGSQMLGLAVGGEGKVELELTIPLKKELGAPSVRGTAFLQDADLRDAKWGLAFDGATGGVRFGDGGFAAEELRVRFDGQPATLSIAVGDYASDETLAAEASLRGRFEIDGLLAVAGGLDWLAPYVGGRSDWSVLLSVPRDDDPGAGEEPGQRLQLRSDLVGTTLGFPAPLRKAAEARLPLVLDATLAGGAIDLQLGRLLRLRGSLPGRGPFAGVAAFGDVEPQPMPQRGLRVAGTVPVLDASGWLAVAAAGGQGGDSDEGGITIDAVDVTAGRLEVLDRPFAETRLRVTDEDGDTRVVLEGTTVDGEIVLPGRDAAARGITARFGRLLWPTDAGADPMLPGGLDPSRVPPLHVWVGELRFGNAELGQARLETWPTPQGLRVQLFESRSPHLELRASGEWTRERTSERSNFQIVFTSEDLGRMLTALGFAGIVEGGQTMARLDATWPGAPAAFELERVDGRLEISVGQGSVPHVEPGAGRLLGLLSLTEIPRRLALDFSDFFTEGFGFNTIRGAFVLDGGNAYTDDLVIDGAAAEIRVRGRTGLKDQTYDQTMEVLPRTSGVLPIVGALAAGPAGAAIGAVAQAVLRGPMKQMTRTLYRVTGSWQEPRIEVLERGPARDPDDKPRRQR